MIHFVNTVEIILLILSLTVVGKALQLHLFFSPFNSFVMLGINTIAVPCES